MAECIRTAQGTDPITDNFVSRPRRPRIVATVASLAAAGAVLVGCGTNAPVAAENTPAVSTTAAPAPKSTPTTSETTSTPPTTSSETSTAETTPVETLEAAPSLCAVSDQLGILGGLASAHCEPVTSAAHFKGLLGGSRWAAGASSVTEFAVQDPNHEQFQYVPTWKVPMHNVQGGLPVGNISLNTICTTDTSDTYPEKGCYAFMQSPADPESDAVFGVETSNDFTEAQRLNMLRDLVQFEAAQGI